MAVRMARLTRNTSGRWAVRKVIPADVRAAFGQREAKRTWDAALTAGQAKAAMAAWLADIENRIASLRLIAAPSEATTALELSQRDCRALAGVWYDDLKARYEANPGDAEGWEAMRDEAIPDETTETYDMTAEEAGTLPLRVSPWVRKEAVSLLASRGLRLTSETTDRVLQEMAGLSMQFAGLMVSRAHGDWSTDTVPDRLPRWQEPTAAKADRGPTITELFDLYVKERKPREATSRQWRRHLAHLERFLGHDDASRITPEDIVRWKDQLLSEPSNKPGGAPRAAKTVREAYLAAAKAVFEMAKGNRRLAINPVMGIKVGGRKVVRSRDPGLSDDEAMTILTATLSQSISSPPTVREMVRRWVPWLCAYTGARVNEITQLRKCDVVQREGVWAIHITPEAGSTKTDEARWVPLHSHLIDQGFLGFVSGSRDGPLFYTTRTADKPGQPPAYKRTGERLALWVREVGVDDAAVQPNHGWRHRFKTTARAAKVDAEAREVIAGHSPKTVGESYGVWTLQSLAHEVEKLPRYSIAQNDRPPPQDS